MRGVNPVRDSDLSHRVDRPDALSHATRAKVSMSSATRPSGPVFRVRITQDAERQFSWWERTRHAMRDTFNRTRMKPHILIASLLTGLIMSGILIALAVLMAINEQTTIADDIEAATVQLSAVAESIVQQSIAPAQALSIIIYEDPDWESIHERFETLAVQILSQLTVSNAELFATLEIAPDTIIKEVYPYDGEAETAIGLRLYDHPIEAARETVRQTISSRAFTFQGPLPVNGTEGREIILVRYPVFVPVKEGAMIIDRANNRASMTGEYYWPIDPPTADEPEGTVFWGFSIVVLEFEEFKSALSRYASTLGKDGRSFGYRLIRPSRKEKDLVLLESVPPPEHHVSRAIIELPNDEWAVEMGLDKDFIPSWWWPAVTAAVVVGFLVGCLMFLALLSNVRHVNLLEALLPRHVIRSLHRGRVVAESLPEVYTLFVDIVQYTGITSDMPPNKVLAMLNDVYALFDELCDVHGVYKLETIGDAYIAVSGAEPGDDPKESGMRVADLAMDILEAMSQFPPYNGVHLQVRVGLHVGPMVAGVVGSRKPKWTLLGDAMNVGSRMESTSEPMKIQVSEEFKTRLLEQGAKYRFVERGDGSGVFIKGKGNMKTFWLLRGNPNDIDDV